MALQWDMVKPKFYQKSFYIGLNMVHERGIKITIMLLALWDWYSTTSLKHLFEALQSTFLGVFF